MVVGVFLIRSVSEGLGGVDGMHRSLILKPVAAYEND